jgi:hypothetical protein
MPVSVFDGLRAQLVANGPEFYEDITLPFYGDGPSRPEVATEWVTAEYRVLVVSPKR